MCMTLTVGHTPDSHSTSDSDSSANLTAKTNLQKKLSEGHATDKFKDSVQK